MKKLMLVVVGMFAIASVIPANAQLPVSELFEGFEDDALGSLPSAYGPAYYGNDNIVVASGTDGIASPDGSAQYSKFIGPRRGSSYWFNDESVNPSELPLGGSISADFYIDPAVPVSDSVYLATTFWVDGVYNGEIGLGYKLLNDGSGNVQFRVTRFQGDKGLQTTAVAAGWFHLSMLFADTDSDGLVDVTCLITDADGATVYGWTEPTALVADDSYTTAGFQVQAGRNVFVPLRIDNLLGSLCKVVELTTKKGYIDLADLSVMVKISEPGVVAAAIGGVEAYDLVSRPKQGITKAWFVPTEMTDGMFVGELADGTPICGEIEIRKTVSLTVAGGVIKRSDPVVWVLIPEEEVVAATIGGVDALLVTPFGSGWTLAMFVPAGMTDGTFVGERADGLMLMGKVKVRGKAK